MGDYVTIDGVLTMPAATLETLQGYIEHGIPPGGCVRAILANDLFGAMASADIGNRHSMHSICSWIYCHAPMNCRGSYEAVDAWIAGHLERRRSVVGEMGGGHE